MPKIRLLRPGMESFSSYMGPVKFLNGVSEDHVSRVEINRIGALTAIEVVEDDGSTHQGGEAANYVAIKNKPAPMLKPSKRGAAVEPPKHVTPPDLVVEAPKPAPKKDEEFDIEVLEAENAVDEAYEKAAEDATEITPVAIVKWNREGLERVADDKGIAGLREVAPEGVRGTSIVGMIDKILEAQKG